MNFLNLKLKMLQRVLNQNRIIFLLAFLFCLPCPTKRELKKAFDIPVSDIVKEDTNKIHCVSTYAYTVDLLSTAKDFKSNHPYISAEVALLFQETFYKEPSETWLFNYQLRTSKVPIYIHNEQYRI